MPYGRSPGQASEDLCPVDLLYNTDIVRKHYIILRLLFIGKNNTKHRSLPSFYGLKGQ